MRGVSGNGGQRTQRIHTCALPWPSSTSWMSCLNPVPRYYDSNRILVHQGQELGSNVDHSTQHLGFEAAVEHKSGRNLVELDCLFVSFGLSTILGVVTSSNSVQPFPSPSPRLLTHLLRRESYFLIYCRYSDICQPVLA
jgi:hypothetical protein